MGVWIGSKDFPDERGDGRANGGAAEEVSRGFPKISILGEASQAIESSGADLLRGRCGLPGALRTLVNGSDERTRHGALLILPLRRNAILPLRKFMFSKLTFLKVA